MEVIAYNLCNQNRNSKVLTKFHLFVVAPSLEKMLSIGLLIK